MLRKRGQNADLERCVVHDKDVGGLDVKVGVPLGMNVLETLDNVVEEGPQRLLGERVRHCVLLQAPPAAQLHFDKQLPVLHVPRAASVSPTAVPTEPTRRIAQTSKHRKMRTQD